ncbi:hypothetical protein ANN_06076 [Periplaneta americana]|uniref:Uncharacterized protein n=1 Tax=Periplaneta americana TaxID=6978 RepID=A0ABQ8TCJ6_PERAM|nr:hypothetical protein ANN_06076 [Periplaneta americana]
MGPRRISPERQWQFFASCFPIVSFRDLVMFHGSLGPLTCPRDFFYVKNTEKEKVIENKEETKEKKEGTRKKKRGDEGGEREGEDGGEKGGGGKEKKKEEETKEKKEGG